MFRNILVISDNIVLCKSFLDIFNSKNYKEVKLDFGISSFLQKEKFDKELKINVQVLDLKLKNEVLSIIENYDLVFSVHCKQIFPPLLVDNVKCLNIHPGYNPINRGWFPQVFSIIYNLPIGATIHEIDNELDNGGIIDREYVIKESYDTSLSLYNRIIKKEVELLSKNLDAIINNTYKTIKPENKGNLFLKKDYNKLLELDLNEELTMQECFDKLRALTHGDYNNAFFIDKKTNKKVFVSINLKIDD